MVKLKEIKDYIEKSKNINALNSIRAKVNKRIKCWPFKKEESVFADIPAKDKKEVLKDLFV